MTKLHVACNEVVAMCSSGSITYDIDIRLGREPSVAVKCAVKWDEPPSFIPQLQPNPIKGYVKYNT